MAIVNFNKKTFEKEIGKINEKMEDKISMFGTPVERINEKEIRVEVFPNRPDLLSYHGFKRSFLAFLGKKTGIKKYKIKSPEKNYKVIINSSVRNVRPFTACAIIKGLKLDDERIKEIIDIQEKLHVTIGRKRKKLAIGIYPLEKIKLPITFKALKPSEIKFTPIDSEKEMSGLEILKKHSAGKEYAHLLKGKEKFPVFIDSNSNILSMPPIINSRLTGKITEKTRDVFLECSGFDYDVLEKCTNILSTMLSDMGGQIYQMEIKSTGKKKISPNLNTEEMKISIDNTNKLLGLNLNEKQIKNLTEKMGYNYKKPLTIEIPSWRMDILHEVDLIEDIAIAYGYENFVPEIPEISTVGQEYSGETIKRKISEILIGINMLEVSNYHLTNEKNQFGKMGIQKNDFIELKESKTDYAILRKDLSHYMLKTLSENVDSEYPQKIFEIGKIFSLNENGKITESESLAVAVSSGNFTEIRQVIEYLFKMINMKIKIEEAESQETPKYFIRGRVTKIILDGKTIGFMGEIHPRILRKWKIKMPVALYEISLEEVFGKLI